MAERSFRISKSVLQHLETVGLLALGPKLEALGVRSVHDLELVDDADLVRWGLTTIERRRFFGLVRKVVGERDVRSANAAIGASGSSGLPVFTVIQGGDVHHELPRLAERLLAATGPLDVPDLAERLARAAPQLLAGYAAEELPRLVEACVRGYKRLRVEDRLGDAPVVSIRSAVLFSASWEVIADTACWVCVCTGLPSPGDLAVVAALCRASREVVDGPDVWTGLMRRWYPKATLLNPDWVVQAELEKNLEAALEDNYSLAAVTMGLKADAPHDLNAILDALPQRSTPKAVLKWMGKHTDHFRQSPDGSKFCVARRPEDLQECKDWRAVNPFRPPPPALPRGEAGEAEAADGGREPPSGKECWVPESEQLCKELDAKQAFRLYHSGLLLQRSEQSKRGKLEAWEYYTESNSKCVLAPGDLLDLAECRVRAIRASDPAVVHQLVSQTIEGMVFKVPFGFWHRRVQILTRALNDSQLRIGRAERKKFERKLLEFMEWVKKERGFGFYHCEACGSRWKSGFSYEEMAQECLQCGAFAKPYRIRDLDPHFKGGEHRLGGAGGPLVEGRRSAKVRLVAGEAASAPSRRLSPGEAPRDRGAGAGSFSPLPRLSLPSSSEDDRLLRLDSAAAGRMVRHHAERPDRAARDPQLLEPAWKTRQSAGRPGPSGAEASATGVAPAIAEAANVPATSDVERVPSTGAAGGDGGARGAASAVSALGLSFTEAQALGLV